MNRIAEKLITIQEVSEITRLAPSTIREKCDPKYTPEAKRLPRIKIGKRVLFKLSEVLEWIERHRS